MRKQTAILILGAVLCANAANAQRRRPAAPQPQAPIRATRSDTTIKGTTLEVYQVYQPELKPIVKPEILPTLPPVAKEPTPQQYEVPQQTLNYSYSALPLRPLALGRDTATLPPQNYALLGGGNLSTILAEAGLGGLRYKNWNTVLYGRYITQDGPVENQLFRNLSLKGDANKVSGVHIWEAGAWLSRKNYGLYGYDHSQNPADGDSVRNNFTLAGAHVGLRNYEFGNLGGTFSPRIAVALFSANTIHSQHYNEWTTNVLLPYTRQIDTSLSIQLGLNALIASGKLDVSYQSNIYQLEVAGTFRKNRLTVFAGVYPTAGTYRKFELLPDIKASHVFFENRLLISIGYQSKLYQTTAQTLTNSNPYIAAAYSIQPNLEKRAFAKADAVFGKHLSCWGGVAWLNYQSLPIFTVYPQTDGREFAILLDNGEAIEWNGGLKYAVNEDFSISAEGTWYNYYKHSFEKVFGEPAVRLKGYASWRLTDELLITSYAEVLDKIWNLNASDVVVEQRGVFDLGAAGEYTFASRFSVFLRADNLLGRKNERWLGYPSFGFNIYGGLRFRF